MAAPTDEIEALVHSKYQQLRALVPGLPAEPGDTTTPYSGWEAEWLLRGLQESLFRIEPKTSNSGYTEMHYVGDMIVKPNGSPLPMHFLYRWSRKTGVRGVWREGLTQMATAAYLVIKLGCDSRRVQLEPGNYGFDLLVCDRPWLGDDQAQPVVCAEVKTTSREVAQLVAGMRHCGGGGSEETHLYADGGPTSPTSAHNHHNKCIELLGTRGYFVWAVPPDPEAQIICSVTYDELSFRLSSPVGEDVLRAAASS